MEKLILDEKEYIKASKAAKDLGYTTDYVGQLCRSGKVPAHLVGRTWYVLAEALSKHKVEKKRTSRIRAREQARSVIDTYKKNSIHIQKNNVLSAIHYEDDNTELIPMVRKISVVEENGIDAVQGLHLYDNDNDKDGDSDNEPLIENKGEKIVMQGDIRVVDVTETPIDPQMVRLTPQIIKNKKRSTKKETTSDIVEKNAETEIHTTNIASFTKKLETNNISEHAVQILEKKIDDIHDKNEMIHTQSIPTTNSSISIIPYLIFLLVITLISAMSIALYTSIQYIDDTHTTISLKFNKDAYKEIYDILAHKI